MFKPIILIVDDLAANRLAFEELLADLPVDILQAASGAEALQLLLQHEVALVLLDVQMPEMDGYEVADLMQKASRTRAIPIIFITAINHDIQHILRGYENGAVDFLSKPVEPVVLQSKVRVFLELAGSRRELEAANRALAASLRELERVKEQNEMLLGSVGEGILSLDPRGQITYANPAAEALLAGYGRLIGSSLVEHLAGRDVDDVVERLLAHCLQGASWRGGLYGRRAGQVFPIDVTATPIRADDESYGSVSIVLKDVTDRHRLEQKLKAETERDPLTGLTNRRGLDRLLRQHIDQGMNDWALLYVDLDNFKPVNDRFGHKTGDVLLRFIARRLKGAVRDNDHVARIGGDEFCIILHSDTPAHAAALVAAKLLDVVAQPLRWGAHRIEIGASIGLVVPAQDADVELVLHQADLAMYAAKAQGRNRACAYEPSLEAQAAAEDALS